jgi:hypothetical protein
LRHIPGDDGAWYDRIRAARGLEEVEDMVYRGHVENGFVRLDEVPLLPEGAPVEVRLLTGDTSQEEDQAIPSLYERLKNIVGKAEGLPTDLAENHDYYLHGQAKR